MRREFVDYFICQILDRMSSVYADLHWFRVEDTLRKQLPHTIFKKAVECVSFNNVSYIAHTVLGKKSQCPCWELTPVLPLAVLPVAIRCLRRNIDVSRP